MQHVYGADVCAAQSALLLCVSAIQGLDLALLASG
jgi:hypothetical protein